MASWGERNVVNRATRLGARLGRDVDGIRELEVRGRRSGKPRRVPVKVLEVEGERYVVSLRGSSDWVRNLRSQETARLRFGRRIEDVVATELADDEKRPIVRAYLAAASRDETRKRLEWAADGVREEDARRGAMTVPVFRLSAAGGSSVIACRFRSVRTESTTPRSSSAARFPRRCARSRTTNHIISETHEAHDGISDLPAGSIVIAGNGSGDLLLVLADADDVVWWDHETAEVEPVTVDWG